jgi:hypothetical protein
MGSYMEILGLINAIENTIADCARVPFSGKILIPEKKMIELLAKLRVVAQTNGEVARRAVRGEGLPPKGGYSKVQGQQRSGVVNNRETAVLSESEKQQSGEIKSGADAYAKEVLEHLMAVTTKIQRTIENGKARLNK